MVEFIELSDAGGYAIHVRADTVSAVWHTAVEGTHVDSTGGHTYFVQQAPDRVLAALREALPRQQEADYAARTAVGRQVLHGTPPVEPYGDSSHADDCPF
jgi:hypothetical protein